MNLKAGSGTAQDGPYVASSSRSGAAGAGKVRPSSVHVVSGEDPLAPEVGADLAHQVETAVLRRLVDEAGEHVEPAHHAVALDDVDPEGGAAVAVGPEAALVDRPLEPERLAHHVGRVGLTR